MRVLAYTRKFRVPVLWLTVLAMAASLWFWNSTANAGSAQTWTISGMSGRVNIIRSGAAPVSLTTGDTLRSGDTIETDVDSSATLVRNGESIVIAPNSRMGLPATNDSGFSTLIMQSLGTLLFKVEKQQQQHFEVKTPYLAAVVKGTTFAVNVSSAGTSVHVIEGAVQVADLTGKVGLVRPGQTALVSSAPGATLSIKGDAPKVPLQRSDAAPDQGAEQSIQLAELPVATDAQSATATPTGLPDSAGSYVIEQTVGSLDIDIATATNGLIQPKQMTPVAGTNAGSGAVGSTLRTASGTTASVGSSGGQVGSAGSSAVASVGGSPGTGSIATSPAVGNLGGAPVIGDLGGGGGLAASSPTASLPETASTVTQAVVPPVVTGTVSGLLK